MVKKSDRKIIRRRVGTDAVIEKGWGGHECVVIKNTRTIYLESSFVQIFKEMNAVMREFPEFSDFEFEAVQDCGCRHDCSCGHTYYVTGRRLETELEYEFRLKKEAQQKAELEARERAEYEKLKAKFS